jgi:hypothetical protein
MAELGRPERLQIMLNEDELAALDDWRFERRMPSRAAAIRELFEARADCRGRRDGRGRPTLERLRGAAWSDGG